ncbi:cupin domain-containing protein [Pelomonas sp. P7]|uniref:Cupin domain-containing protein n=1 Tax=Pelomonas caseinilytica TaxID=2906763 RepID=A0ABS8XEV1_9BURK|nr:cupin domain-containing protein [Pelomonas sp. P7]MCE4539432.1 cupin domain-containing protein [Pelomonas sp. P7]
MYVAEQTPPRPTELPGIAHVTWAGIDDGLEQLSVWRQSMAPGTATPPHVHDCDEVVFCLGGSGELHIDGQALRIDASSVLRLPGGRPHQIFNTGSVPLETLAVFARTPVPTRWPEGGELPLPWRS